MNILFCSVPFRPSVGGIETVSALLAEQFHACGHRVTLVTRTPSPDPDPEPFTIVRDPSPGRLWSLVAEADVVFHNNISLRLAWPLLLLRRPWIVAHHTWIPRVGAGRLKRWALRLARNVSVSQAIADDLPVASTVVGNPYRASLFRPVEGIERTRDIVFVGRLVSDKGVAVLLDALHRLAARGLCAETTIVGEGPEALALRQQAARLGLTHVRFSGHRSGAALVEQLHAHRLLVVPSMWEEPFGVVVLEALACGCVPVVAASGGLPDAAGPGGRVFAKGDAAALAGQIEQLLGDPQQLRWLQRGVQDHLQAHQPERVAARYLRVLSDACAESRPALAA